MGQLILQVACIDRWYQAEIEVGYVSSLICIVDRIDPRCQAGIQEGWNYSINLR